MIDEKDLPFLVLIEEKLIATKNSSFCLTIGNFENVFNDNSHFNNLVSVLIEYGVAEKPIGSGSLPDNIIAIIKTDKTGYERIQDIFNKEQKLLKSKSLEIENTFLTNDSLKYQQTIRTQEQKIRDLTEKKLRREFVISIISLIIGILLKYFFDKYIDDKTPYYHCLSEAVARIFFKC